ncbi:hypothetical protein J6Y73_02875 [bacterium]|nr:hypothetical protein [bacterium]
MIIYSIILMSLSIVFLILALLIYNGNIHLIISYHTSNVKEADKIAYCKSFSISLFIIFITFLISSLIGLFLHNLIPLSPILSTSVLFIGLFISILVIIKVQNKYNGGLF